MDNKLLAEKCKVLRKVKSNQDKFKKAVKTAKKIYNKPSNTKKFTTLVKEERKKL
jgi:hypothetical protein